MKVATNQERLNELFDADPRNDTAIAKAIGVSKANTDKLYPQSEQYFYKLYYAAIQEAGITRHLTPYSCRHTTATVLAVHENVAPQTLQRIMRWKSTRMMDRYVTPSDSDAIKAVNKI